MKRIFCFLLLICFTITFSSCNSVSTGKEIPDNYIAVFHGGSGEMTHETYIYISDNSDKSFAYINTESWGMTASDWKQRILKKGEVNSADELFSVAEENGAYSYVKLPGDTNVYTITEFQDMFDELTTRKNVTTE